MAKITQAIQKTCDKLVSELIKYLQLFGGMKGEINKTVVAPSFPFVHLNLGFSKLTLLPLPKGTRIRMLTLR